MTRNATSAAARLAEYDSPELAARVYSTFHDDFEAFGPPQALPAT